ncbi:hypothetical protein AAMO2058_001571400 [Amorphochlora amoebiformis]
MGNSSAKRQKQVNKILEELFEEGLTNEKRTYLVQKIWKLVDPEKSGYLGEKRALLLIKALVRYCNTRALRVLLKSPRRGRWHWLTKSRNKKNSKRSKSINMTITDGMKEFKCSRDEFVIKSKRADSEWNDRVPNRRHRSSELEDFADFRLNNAGEDSDYVQNFLHRIDLDCDGVVTEKEFRIWMTHALDDPVQAVKDVLKKKAPSEIEKQSQATQMHSTNVILKSYRKRRNRTVSTDFDRKFVRSPPSQTKRKQLEEERNFIHDMELFDHSPLTVSTPYGMGQAIDPERDGKLTLHFPWGGTGHFVRKSMKDRMSGSIQLKYENLKLAFTVNEPGALSPPRDQQLMLTLHRQLALEDIDEETIKNLTDDQLKHFLPLLLKRPSNQLKKRLGNNLELLRRAFWRINAAPEYVSGFYIDFVTKKAPKIQKHNTVKFFRDRITSLEAKEKTRFDSLTIFCPLFPSRIVERVDVVKKFSSGHSPFLLSVQFRGLPSLPVQVIYKPDECRADMACLTMFRVFNMCWETSMLKPLQPYAYTFEVWPLGYKSGIIEFIQNAVELQGYDCNKISKLKEEDLSEFLRSAAGSYVACYIMGCRDRHKSNFMIKDDKTFLQIDFKHCFDRQTRGVDAPHFSVMKGMKKALKERGRWNTFKELCQEAFRILRRRNQYLIRICLQIFNGLWFTENEMETWLLKAFRSHETEPQACAAIPKLINEGVSSIQRKLKSWTHKKSLERLRKKTMSVDLKIQTNPLGDFVPKNNVAISPDDERVEYGYASNHARKPNSIRSRSRSRLTKITNLPNPRTARTPPPPTTHPRYATLDRFDKITPNYFTKKLNTSSPPVRTPPNPHTSRPTSRAGLRVIEPSHKHSRAKSLGSWPWRSSTPV